MLLKQTIAFLHQESYKTFKYKMKILFVENGGTYIYHRA